MEELKKSIGEGILMEKQKKEKERVRSAIIKEIVSKSKKEIPEKVVELEISRIEEEFKHSISDMGLDFDVYLDRIKKNREELRIAWRDQARERAEISLALDAIARKENINLSEEEIKTEADNMLRRYKKAKDAEKDYDPEALRSYVIGVLRNKKVFEFLEQYS